MRVIDGWVDRRVDGMTDRAAAKAARRGARLLDQREPGWHQAVNLTQLDISDGNACVLGQVFEPQTEWQQLAYGSGYNRGMYLLGLEYGGSCRHGFAAYRCSYGQLEEAWTAEVEKRTKRVRVTKEQAANHLALVQSIEARRAEQRAAEVLAEAAAVVNAVDPIRHYRQFRREQFRRGGVVR